ncbi:DUF418 domain-containing protein [Plantactinospora sp. KLBMP9567]|uniref:DUF418 domain-containing protein n=1 Tax=Plantactinospora sp. KLBMP9567 TaxID=3085900 RepID=UPI002981E353|nr:DUF418 domain-containing protein [Plantactinospora sp. KLBMP9567]MDW5323582.1 DUF418 domain-containing protein [Plantactinospora sp. KLBMP9567]
MSSRTEIPAFARPAAPGPPSYTAGRRLGDIDALRSFALFGILVVNIAFFATAFPWHGIDDPAFSSGLDQAVRWVVALLFELKFYLLFAFLFGYSFTLQFDSAARQGAAFVPRFLRRLAGLFVIGAAHAVLLFHGDILSTYAVLGLILLVVRGIRPRTALVTAGVLTGVVALFLTMSALSGTVFAPDAAAAIAAGQESTETLRGDPGSVIVEHLRAMPQMLAGLAGFQGPLAMAAFLVGLAAGKRQVLADAGRYRRALRIVQYVGYPVGLAGGVVLASTGGTTRLNMFAVAVTVLTAPLLTAAYVGTLLEFFRTRPGRRLAAVLAPAGQMALSNYLGQSVVCAILFTGWGFGLIGHVSPLTAVLLAVAIFLLQVLVSARWLATHRYGPAEFYLRAATNAAWPAWRRQPA